ncbi:hypothetical protein [Oceanobacillus sojae]|uniref:hypothetical protein n=1 Tax=Oceanobacillus sojae TaxID=582851 RepID=UPI0021A267B6|nr:hypothetical protein [Oceanobacillus sojae]MCT1904864.1 hypothetical protein [Oceanobacillus sojae]
MMVSQRADKLTTKIEDLRNSLGEKIAAKLELDKCNRLVQRLHKLSSECEKCYQYFIDFEKHITELTDKSDQLTKNDFKQHSQKLENISAHLLKEHKLVSKDYYLSIYMSLGLTIGLIFGLLFDNLALGLPIGLGIGVAIGAGLDADVKKKGKTL